MAAFTRMKHQEIIREQIYYFKKKTCLQFVGEKISLGNRQIDSRLNEIHCKKFFEHKRLIYIIVSINLV